MKDEESTMDGNIQEKTDNIIKKKAIFQKMKFNTRFGYIYFAIFFFNWFILPFISVPRKFFISDAFYECLIFLSIFLIGFGFSKWTPSNFQKILELSGRLFNSPATYKQFKREFQKRATGKYEKVFSILIGVLQLAYLLNSLLRYDFSFGTGTIFGEAIRVPYTPLMLGSTIFAHMMTFIIITNLVSVAYYTISTLATVSKIGKKKYTVSLTYSAFIRQDFKKIGYYVYFVGTIFMFLCAIVGLFLIVEVTLFENLMLMIVEIVLVSAVIPFLSALFIFSVRQLHEIIVSFKMKILRQLEDYMDKEIPEGDSEIPFEKLSHLQFLYNDVKAVSDWPYDNRWIKQFLYMIIGSIMPLVIRVFFPL